MHHVGLGLHEVSHNPHRCRRGPVTPRHVRTARVGPDSAVQARAERDGAPVGFADETGVATALRGDDVDLEKGTAFGRAKEYKGKRDVLIPLHPIVVGHLKRVPSFSPVFFPWNHGRRHIYDVLLELRAAAGVKPDRKARYGFHDLRRAFATKNADKLSPDARQALMQHQDDQTTQRYINMARQLQPAVEGLFVPDLGKKKAEGQA